MKSRTASPKTVKQICAAAADLIERDGWCKGNFSYRGRHCLVGAVDTVTSNSAIKNKAFDRLRELIFCPLVSWNDSQRSRKPVIALLRRAAK